MAKKLTKEDWRLLRADLSHIAAEKLMPKLLTEVEKRTERVMKRLKVDSELEKKRVRQSILQSIHAHITQLAFD